jgi:hypothetical protein
MNPTDEYILDAFKQQGLLSGDMVAEITAEVEAEGESLVGDKGTGSYERSSRQDRYA